MRFMNALAWFCVRHRWVVALAWPALAAGLIAGAAVAAGPSDDDFSMPGSETQQAADLIGDRGDEPVGSLVLTAPGGMRAPDVRRAVTDLVARVDAVPGVTVRSREERISADGTVTLVPLEYEGTGVVAPLKNLRDSYRPPPGAPALTVELSGDDFASVTPGGLTEGIGLLAAAVILLLAFRSLIAMALPLLVGIVGVVCGVSLLALLQNFAAVPSFAVFLTIMLGLGVGIDYALLIVTRFRTALAAGTPVPEAVVTAMNTAGRSVLFAGFTVILTGSGILFLGPELGGGMALAAGSGVLMVMLAALTLLPALLSRIGTRIDRFGLPRRRAERDRPERRLSYRWSRVIQRRPLPALVVSALLLGVLALPAADLRFGWSDASDRAVSDTTRRAHDLLSRGFGPGAEAPVLLASREPIGPAVRQAAAMDGVAEAIELNATTGMVIPATAAQDERTTELVHRLRDELPAPVLVTGWVAAGVDYAEHSLDRLPLTVGAVLLASFLLLIPLFRSLVLPLKAIVVNLLSVAASYGLVVAVFQWDVLGTGVSGPIDAWVPMMLFVVTYGLSMDYEVFLLSRIREEYASGRANADAVAEGLAASARVITAAAAIMFCVFAAFAAFDDRALRTMGAGLAAAVLIDATVVRLVLVPAAMELLGDLNWWFPGRRSRVPSHVAASAVTSPDRSLPSPGRRPGA
ncbi:MMPL family transporter [Spongiactinospora sp. TRM90649]|uniref:MMPL family transporter n=1 Tax=Spongiactinospora sp. TRM90649 TaxID=3031114 RepID=UPI0023F8D146|nr:MMPL family transporter [Spongiactinospora sp. TRM90649]MDF5753331.1 MMPL family transporter [Spongiactinospora sp. TRM90649]